jgi:hypothetical protein
MKNLVKGGSFPHNPLRFKEFTELMRKLALQQIENYSEAHKKGSVDVIPDPRGDERYINFALEDLVKKIIRFRSQRSENDMGKLALWAYLLWMKLYPKQDRQAYVGMD